LTRYNFLYKVNQFSGRAERSILNQVGQRTPLSIIVSTSCLVSGGCPIARWYGKDLITV